MKLTGWIQRKNLWLGQPGPEDETILSTRCRLARNFPDLPFPHRADLAKRRMALERVQEKARNSELGRRGEILNISDLDEPDLRFLIERHLISHSFAASSGADGRAVWVADGEIGSVMINEEDHLRLQAYAPGLDAEHSWTYVLWMEQQIGDGGFAFEEEFGFLAACPTNTGTGLRASVLAHLPGLVRTDQIGEALKGIGQFGFTARGLYGEGTRVFGDLFQISNSFTLGLSEEEIRDGLVRLARRVSRREMEARHSLAKTLPDPLEKAASALLESEGISYEQAVEALSLLRMASTVGIQLPRNIPADRRLLTGLMFEIQPGHIQERVGKPLGPSERDVARAAFLRRRLLPETA